MRYSGDYGDWDNYVEAGTHLPASVTEWVDADMLASQAAYAEWQDRRREAEQKAKETPALYQQYARRQDRANRLVCVLGGGALTAVLALLVWAAARVGPRLFHH